MKPCEVSLAHKINQIKNKAESARTMALALLLFLQTQLNIMPIGIRKKTNIGKMERVGLMPLTFIFRRRNKWIILLEKMNKGNF